MLILSVSLCVFFLAGAVLPILFAEPPDFRVDWGQVVSSLALSLFFGGVTGAFLKLPHVQRVGRQHTNTDFEKTRKAILDDYTPAERRQMEQEETARYVANLAAHAMRDVSYSEDDTRMYWQHYVIDQSGRKHVIDAGVTEIVPGHRPPLEVVNGEVWDKEVSNEKSVVLAKSER